MQDWLAATANARPGALALLADGQAWTYRALNEQVGKLSGRLVALGVQRGDHVGLLMANRAEYVQLIHALARIGAVVVPLNMRLKSAEIEYQIGKARCTHVIYGPEVADNLIPLTPSPLRREGASFESISLAALNTSGDQGYCAVPKGEVDLDAVQAIVFSSGTSGRPKGAQLTFGNFFHGANASAWRLGTLPNDQWLACLPLFHVGGLAIVCRCCLYGIALVLEPGFDVERIRKVLASQPVTLVSLVPTMLYRLLEANVDFPAALRLVLLGGAAANAELVARSAQRRIPVATTYGLTESTSQVATLLPDEVLRKPGSVGKPLTFNSIAIVDDQRQPVPPGEVGEVVVRGPTVMRGYFEMSDDTVLSDGALYTGDMGYLDADGDLWIVQRRTDLIVSGGENVYPAEVENVIRQHPAVAEACVIGVPDREWGQVVSAAVVVRPDASLTVEALDEFLSARLARYKRPRNVRFLAELPQTGSGKIDRRRIAEFVVGANSQS